MIFWERPGTGASGGSRRRTYVVVPQALNRSRRHADGRHEARLLRSARGRLARPPPTRSRKPIARWPSSFIRTAIRVTTRRPSGSRKRRKRTRSSPTRRSGSGTTATATPGLNGTAIHDFRSTDDIMSAFSDIFGGGLFGDLFGERRRGPRPGPDLLMKLEIELVEAARGTTPVDRREPAGVLQRVPRVRRPQGDVADDLQLLRRPRPDRPGPRLLPGRDHLPGLRRRGRPDHRPLPQLPRRGPRAQHRPPPGRRPARRRERHVAAAAQPGRAGRRGRAARQPPDPDPGEEASVLRAAAERPDLPGADQLRPGGAWAR